MPHTHLFAVVWSPRDTSLSFTSFCLLPSLPVSPQTTAGTRDVSTELTSIKSHPANIPASGHSLDETSSGATTKVTSTSGRKVQRGGDPKTRILKQTLVIIITFLVCWTPYVLATLWYHIDVDSYMKLDQTVSSTFYLFAVSNSIINPFIYGKFVNDNSQRV